MNYPPVSQTPIIEGNLVVGWTLRVRAEDGALFGEIEERVDLPVEEHKPIQDWDSSQLEKLLTKVASERTMHYRATKIVMDAKGAA